MAYAALVSAAQTIHQIQNNGSYSISSPEKQKITSIHEHLIFVQSFLEEFPDKANRKLEGRIRKISNQVEDKIEYFLSEQSQLRYGSINSNGGRSNDDFEHHPRRAAQWNDWNKLTEEVDSIVREVKAIRINSVTTREASLADEHSAAAAASSSRIRRPSHKKEALVGFDDNLMEIKERLCGEPSKLQVIPIVGMGGIGKTTLARNAYHHPLITERFDVRAWVTVSQDYIPQRFYSDLLIVVDDMWSTEAWDDVRMIFPDDDNGSRIMLTTRLSDVAAYADSSRRISWIMIKVGICFGRECFHTKKIALMIWKKLEERLQEAEEDYLLLLS